MRAYTVCFNLCGQSMPFLYRIPFFRPMMWQLDHFARFLFPPPLALPRLASPLHWIRLDRGWIILSIVFLSILLEWTSDRAFFAHAACLQWHCFFPPLRWKTLWILDGKIIFVRAYHCRKCAEKQGWLTSVMTAAATRTTNHCLEMLIVWGRTLHAACACY